jgi:hypothetical protein
MPLRVQVDGADIVAPLEEQQWEDLRAEVRAGIKTLRLPCCGSKAFQRVSHYGTQHFVHQRILECDWKPESAEHLAIKAEIVLACRAIGLKATTEARGDGWRADVLVETPSRPAVFEIQLTAQSREETLHRQQAFIDADLRCCWLFGPPGTKRDCVKSSERVPWFANIAPDRKLPLFCLVQSESGFMVSVNGRELSLRDFVTRLLRRELRYCEQSESRELDVYIDKWSVNCWSCQQRIQLLFVHAISLRAPCGYEAQRQPRFTGALLPPEHLSILATFLKNNSSYGSELAVQDETNTSARASNDLIYACVHCGVAKWRTIPSIGLPGLRLGKAGKETVTLSKPRMVEYHHWCEHPLCSRRLKTFTRFAKDDLWSAPDIIDALQGAS